MKLEILQYAIRLISRKDYFKLELYKKIEKKFSKIDVEEIEKVFEYLKKKKFLDEERLIKNYILYYKKKAIGQKMMEYKLKNKGANCKKIKKIFDETNIDETSLAKIAGEKKMKTKNITKEKLMRFLQSRGFSSSVVFDTCDYFFKKY